jgi:para-nitrobenzyl esterase
MKNNLLPLFFVLAVVLMISCTNRQNKLINSIVKTEYGKLQGVANEDRTVVSFKGIPYALPPVNELRWREPKPPVDWKGIRDASKFCSNCMQLNNRRLPWTDEYMIRGETSEDCLFLNIWTPAKTAMDNLPVLVFLHGGGLREGSGSIDVYDGEELAKKGIIVITINYRLGVFGFLAHPWLASESSYNASGNYGIMDQIAALKWIKGNIAAFGGNPEKVTVSGQSAGSRSVHMLTASPLAKGLINGAVTMSGASMERIKGFISSDTALARGIRYTESKGVSNLEELRALPASELIADFGASVDGYVLPEAIDLIFEKRQQNDVASMSGLVADEGSSGERYGKRTVTEFIEDAKNLYKDQYSKFLELYPVNSDEQAGNSTIEADRVKGRIDLFKWAAFRARTAETPAFTYYFNKAIPWPEHPEFGTFHTGDVIYWFNNLKKLDRHWTREDSILAERASSYLVNFVISGNPNGEGLPEWPIFEETKKETMELGAELHVIPIATDEEIEFFKGQ